MMELIFELIVLTFLTEKVYVYVSMMLASQGNRVWGNVFTFGSFHSHLDEVPQYQV